MKDKIEAIYIDALNEDLAPNVFTQQVLELLSSSLPTQEDEAEEFDKRFHKCSDEVLDLQNEIVSFGRWMRGRDH